MLVGKGQVVDFQLVGIGTQVAIKEPGDPEFIPVHTSVAVDEMVRIIGPVEVDISGGTFSRSSAGVRAGPTTTLAA